MELKCKKCGLNLGEMTKGKLRNNTILLCSSCWQKAMIAMEVAEMAANKNMGGNNDLPDFMQDLLNGKRYGEG